MRLQPLQVGQRIFVGLSILCLLIFAAVCLQAIPTKTDMAFTQHYQSYGFWGMQYQYYMAVSGRYTVSFLMALCSLFGYKYYSLYCLGLLCLFFSAIYYLLDALFEDASKKQVFTITIVTNFVILMALSFTGGSRQYQVIYQSFCQLTSGVTFAIACASYIALVASLYRYIKCCTVSKAIPPIFFAIFAIGCNEIMMVLVMLTIFFVLICYMMSKHRLFLLTLFLMVLLASLMVIVSPSYVVRQVAAMQHSLLVMQPLEFSYAWWNSFYMAIGSLFIWCINPFNWLLVILFHRELATVAKKLASSFSWLIALPLLLLGLMSLFFVPYWSLGHYGQPHVFLLINVFILFFICPYLYHLLCLSENCIQAFFRGKGLPWDWLMLNKLWFVLIMLLISSPVTIPNIYSIAKNIIL